MSQSTNQSDNPTEVLFYHLEHVPMERVLPNLVEKSVARGWRAVIQAGSPERVDALDTLLWTFRDDAFVPHGTAKDGNGAVHPVFLTALGDNPNGASVRFMVDGGEAGDITSYARIVYLFDGSDHDAVEQARLWWQNAKTAGCNVTYWRQSQDGRWAKQA